MIGINPLNLFALRRGWGVGRGGCRLVEGRWSVLGVSPSDKTQLSAAALACLLLIAAVSDPFVHILPLTDGGTGMGAGGWGGGRRRTAVFGTFNPLKTKRGIVLTKIPFCVKILADDSPFSSPTAASKLLHFR